LSQLSESPFNLSEHEQYSGRPEYQESFASFTHGEGAIDNSNICSASSIKLRF